MLLISLAFCFIPFSAYQVIVLKVADGVEELPNNYDSKLKAASDAKKENVNFYIAAEIENFNKPQKFTVGDGNKTKKFVNEELDKGENYIVYERALTKAETVCKLLISKIFLFFFLQPESSDHQRGETVCLFFWKKYLTPLHQDLTLEEAYLKLTRAQTCLH